MANYIPTPSNPSTYAGQSTVFESIGDKESISDIIGLISPYDTPNYSQFSKRAAIQPTIQWQEDELRAPAANAQDEGFDAGAVTTSATGMRVNYCQLFSETAQASGTSLATEFYGRQNELDYSVMKKGLELKRDIEYALVGGDAINNPLGDFGAATTPAPQTAPRALTSVQGLIGAATTSANGGTLRDFTEALVLEVHEKTYVLGGDPNQLQVTPQHAISVANFAYATGRERDVDNKTKLVNTVDIYQSPFGTLSVVTNKWLKGVNVGAASSDALLLEVDRHWCSELRPLTTEPLAKVGDSERRLLTTELTTGLENRDASGLVTDLNNAFTAV